MIKKVSTSFALITLLLFCGCEGNSLSQPVSSIPSQPEPLPLDSHKVLEKIHLSTPKQVTPTTPDTNIKVIRSQTPYAGNLRYAAGWTDRAGNNVFIISGRLQEGKGEFGKGRMEIFAYQYLESANGWKKEWSINDFVDGWICDLTILLPKKFIQFPDPDEDNILDPVFIYTLDRRCDAVMVSAKLMMHTQGTKLAIRGYAELSLGPSEEIMNQIRKRDSLPPIKYKAFDKAFEGVDERHKSFASALWDEFAVLEL